MSETAELLRDVARAAVQMECVISASFDGSRLYIQTQSAFEVFVYPTAKGDICRVRGVDLLDRAAGKTRYANSNLRDVLEAIDAVMDW